MSHNDLIDSTADSFIEQLDELFGENKKYEKRKDDIIELLKEALSTAIKAVEKESKPKPSKKSSKKSGSGSEKKRGPSGYNLFIKKRMVDLKNFSAASAEWKTMTTEQKQPYNDDAKQRKTPTTDDEHDTDEKKSSKKSGEKSGKKRTPSGYNLFMKEQNAIYKEKGEKGNHMADIAKIWKALSEEKKKTYNDKAKAQTQIEQQVEVESSDQDSKHVDKKSKKRKTQSDDEDMDD